MKKALITGVTCQGSSHLAELLLSKGCEVHDIKRRASSLNTEGRYFYTDQQEANVNFELHYGDLTKTSNLVRLIQQAQPDEFYNLGAMGHMTVSFETPEYASDANAIGIFRILEAIRLLGLEKKNSSCKAPTAVLFCLVQEILQRETTPFYPRSPYDVEKKYACWITLKYREVYDNYACNGILFNHESPCPRRNLRYARNHTRHGEYCGRSARLPLHGNAGLGTRQGLR